MPVVLPVIPPRSSNSRAYLALLSIRQVAFHLLEETVSNNLDQTFLKITCIHKSDCPCSTQRCSENASMAATRLRKTFRYEDDSEQSDDSPDAMDEEGQQKVICILLRGDLINLLEQENLITSLAARDTSQNANYRLIFTFLPLITIVPFFYLMFTSPRSLGLLSIMAISSLCSTAYTMYVSGASNSGGAVGRSALSLSGSEHGPIEKYLPLLNILLAGLLGLSGLVMVKRERDTGIVEGTWMFMFLPAVLLGIVAVARKTMNEVQTGIGELRGLRYGYKGA